MNGKGNCYDNAVVETFFKTMKAELVWRRTWETYRQAETTIFNTSTASITRAEGIQLWGKKAHLPSNARRPK